MSTEQTTTEAQQHDDQQPTTAPVDGTETTTAPRPADQPQDAQNDAQEPAGRTEDTPLAKARAESAQRRVALRETQEHNEALRGQVTALQDAALTQALQAHGVTLEAVKAAGHRDSAFSEDGTVDTEALRGIAADTAKRYGTTKGILPPPDPSLGRETAPGGGAHTTSWQAKLRG